MKLRTVVNELSCTACRASRPELMDADVLLTPEYGSSTPQGMLFVRLSRRESFEEGRARAAEDQVLLVHMGASIPEDADPHGNVVLISHPSTYDNLRTSFLDLPSRVSVLELRRERMFEAFLASYDLKQFARRSCEVIGNPVIITNADLRVLGTAGEFPEDAPDVQEVLAQGYVSETVTHDMEADGVLTDVRHARHSILSLNPRYGRHWVTSIVYFHHLEMGRYDVMEKDRPITGFDLELIDYAGQLAGVMIDRLGCAGERAGSGSSVLNDLVSDAFVNETTMRAQLLLTGIPLGGSYVMVGLYGRYGFDRDYHARVGRAVSRAVRNCLWCEQGSLLAVLVPIGEGDAAGYDDYARAQRRISSNTAFTSMLDNNELHAYVSEPFTDFSFAAARFRQCKALAEGRDPVAHGRIAYFWENRFSMLATSAATFEQLEMMVDKRVVAMAAYDAEHGTSYLATAIMSVRYPGSPAEAAAALNVHRNTYFYRMNKVREMFFLDLKDGDDRLALSFSAKIMEGMDDVILADPRD